MGTFPLTAVSAGGGEKLKDKSPNFLPILLTSNNIINTTSHTGLLKALYLMEGH
jgi:hypothetical protein